MFDVIGPDETALHTTFGDEERAQEIADWMNEAYDLGSRIHNKVLVGNLAMLVRRMARMLGREAGVEHREALANAALAFLDKNDLPSTLIREVVEPAPSLVLPQESGAATISDDDDIPF